MNVLVALCLVALGALVPLAGADGGAVVDRGRYGLFDVTVFVSPVPVTEGMVDISVLVSQDGRPLCDIPTHVRAVGPTGIINEITLTAADSGNRLLVAGSLALDMPGVWDVSIDIGHDSTSRGAFTLKVAPAPPPWRAFLPWMLLWIPVAILMIAREVLVHRQRVVRHAWESGGHGASIR